MKIGDQVISSVTGFEGIIVDYAVIRGHVKYLVLPLKNGQWHDVIQLETTERAPETMLQSTERCDLTS